MSNRLSQYPLAFGRHFRSRRTRLFQLCPLLCVLLLFAACAPVTYRNASGAAASTSAPGPARTAHLAALKTVLAKYGTPVPMSDAPGFIVNSQDYSINARLAGERELDLAVYWVPGNHSSDRKLGLPLVIADIRSRMEEEFAGAYTLQAQ